MLAPFRSRPVAWVLASALGAAVPTAPIAAHIDVQDFEPLDYSFAPTLNARSFRYGVSAWQTVDHLRGVSTASPLIIEIRAGDWREAGQPYSISWLPDHFKRRGFAYARIRFDAVDAKKGSSPIAAVAELPTALAKLRLKAAKVRFNPNELVLLGAGSGGHFATLLATDLKYLSASSVPPSARRRLRYSSPSRGYDWRAKEQL